MNLLVDFGAIKTGGGVQLATNFIAGLSEYPEDIENLYLLLPEKGPLSSFQGNARVAGILKYPDSYVFRYFFEIFVLRKFIQQKKISVIYTFFGAGLPRPKGVKSVVSVAYPIICYPDSPYWAHLPLQRRIPTLIRNHLRKRRIRTADIVLAETPVMARRLVTYAGVAEQAIKVVAPSPSTFVEDRPFTAVPSQEQQKFLFLSGADPHKNLWRLPAIAQAMVDLGYTNFSFLLSITSDAFYSAYPSRQQSLQDIVAHHFIFLGPIPAQAIQSAYAQASFLVNISDLESFSNNYMEAWKAGLPLICSDTDFSRYICGASATYIDPHNINAAAAGIVDAATDVQRQSAQTLEGKQRLSTLPSRAQKFLQTLDILKSVQP